MNILEKIEILICKKMRPVRDFYYALPIIRELYEANILAKMQLVETLKLSHPHFKDPRRLLQYGTQYGSQNFEDGMIEEVFRRISCQDRTFVEIGAGNGLENNTVSLLAAGWRGWWIEGDPSNCANIRAELAKIPAVRKRLVLEECLVSPSDITELFRRLAIPQEVDIFSLDIDMDTYHIWAALTDFRPRLVVVEYNGGISPSVEWISPWKPGRSFDKSQAFGASLKALEVLGRKHGYSLVGCDLTGVNAFFVRNDLVADRFAEPFTSENHYEPIRYRLTVHYGHQPVIFSESHDPKLYPYS